LPTEFTDKNNLRKEETGDSSMMQMRTCGDTRRRCSKW
jgi:hypothetical protein